MLTGRPGPGRTSPTATVAHKHPATKPVKPRGFHHFLLIVAIFVLSLTPKTTLTMQSSPLGSCSISAAIKHASDPDEAADPDSLVFTRDIP